MTLVQHAEPSSGADPEAGTQYRIILSTSIDQYAANLASWFGLPSADFGSVFPNLHNFDEIDLGFMNA